MGKKPNIGISMPTIEENRPELLKKQETGFKRKIATFKSEKSDPSPLPKFKPNNLVIE